MDSLIKVACTILLSIGTINSVSAQQTNLSVAWALCQKHATLIGGPIKGQPARIIFKSGYESCEQIQKQIPDMKQEIIDYNQVINDQMLIDKALNDPNGLIK